MLNMLLHYYEINKQLIRNYIAVNAQKYNVIY